MTRPLHIATVLVGLSLAASAGAATPAKSYRFTLVIPPGGEMNCSFRSNAPRPGFRVKCARLRGVDAAGGC